MKKAGFFITIPLILNFVSQTYANETNIKVSSQGDASATVQVNNSFNSTNSNQVETDTKIRIETNNEVKEYESNGNENIHIQSSNSNSSVIIKNSNDTNSYNTESKQEKILDNIELEDDEENKNKAVINEKPKSFFERVIDAISNFFKNFF